MGPAQLLLSLQYFLGEFLQIKMFCILSTCVGKPGENEERKPSSLMDMNHKKAFITANKGAWSGAYWGTHSAATKLWVLSPEARGRTERQTAKAVGNKGSVLLFGSGGLSIGAEHSSRGRVWPLLEEGPSCCRVSTRLGLIPLG